MAAGPSSRPDIIPSQVEPAESPESSGISLEDVPGLESPAPAMNPQPEAYTGSGTHVQLGSPYLCGSFIE
jgi:hypothetical protein